MAKDGLNFTITQGTVGLSGAKIYYCKNTTNSCTPTTEVASGNVITAHNNQEEIFYMRYRIVSNAGAQSEIYSYKGQTDTVGPTCGSWSGESTSWTASNRTISVGCNDGNSGCSPATCSATITSQLQSRTRSCSVANRCEAAGCQTYKTCANSACGVESYKSCATSGCGCQTYNANVGTCGCATWGAYGA